MKTDRRRKLKRTAFSVFAPAVNNSANEPAESRKRSGHEKGFDFCATVTTNPRASSKKFRRTSLLRKRHCREADGKGRKCNIDIALEVRTEREGAREVDGEKRERRTRTK